MVSVLLFSLPRQLHTTLFAEMASKNTPNDDADVPEETFTEFAKGGGMQADVDELITKFRVKIDKLRQRVIDIVPQDDPQYDDLFYLRYVLSFKVSVRSQLFLSFYLFYVFVDIFLPLGRHCRV